MAITITHTCTCTCTQPSERAADAPGMQNAERITRPVIQQPSPSLRDVIREWLEERMSAGDMMIYRGISITRLAEQLAERIEQR
jgi:hypothetical protein